MEGPFFPRAKSGCLSWPVWGCCMIILLMLGDIHFHPQNQIFILFKNVEGITDKSPVKISGVEVGSVKKVELLTTTPRLTILIRKEIPIYKIATARHQEHGDHRQ